MKRQQTLTEHLTQYAAYHRDRRNIITHFIGIPLIVVAVAILLSRPSLPLYGLWLSPDEVVAAIAEVFYVRLDLRLVNNHVFITRFMLMDRHALCDNYPPVLAILGFRQFYSGWIIQFAGHYLKGVNLLLSMTDGLSHWSFICCG